MAERKHGSNFGGKAFKLANPAAIATDRNDNTFHATSGDYASYLYGNSTANENNSSTAGGTRNSTIRHR